jgi:hypothetical protein
LQNRIYQILVAAFCSSFAACGPKVYSFSVMPKSVGSADSIAIELARKCRENT